MDFSRGKKVDKNENKLIWSFKMSGQFQFPL